MQYQSLISGLISPLVVWGALISSQAFSFSRQWTKVMVYASGENAQDLQYYRSIFEKVSAPIQDSDALCRFPARYLVLKTKFPQLQLDPIKECPKFSEFFNKLSARSVSLIFSSYYINVPASAFGHTLLKFNRLKHEDQRAGDELLDYGINFSALVDTSNALIYALKGMLGLFPGKFSAVPYYYKVREYNDYESRDLWEYQLDFDQKQIDLMVAFVWELAQENFPYYYFTQNCSFHMLSILEVGNPNLDLISKLPFYVIPIDTIRTVTSEAGMVKNIKFRPSAYSKLVESTKDLSTAEQQKLKLWARSPEKIHEHLKDFGTDEFKAKKLDQVVLAYDYLNAEKVLKEEKVVQEQRHQLLKLRSQLDYISPMPHWESNQVSPHLGHETEKVGLSWGWLKPHHDFLEIDYRFALHDLLDPLRGQLKFSAIEFVHPRLRWEKIKEVSKIHLERVDWLKVANIEPINPWSRSLSWLVNIETFNVREKKYYGTDASGIVLNGGWTLGQEALTFTFWLKNQVHYSALFPGKGRLLVGPESLIRLQSEKWSSGLGLAWDQSWFFDEFKHSASFLGVNWESRYFATPQQQLSLHMKAREYTDQEMSLGWSLTF